MGLRRRVILIVVIPAVVAVGIHGVLRVREEEKQLLAENRRNMELTATAMQIAVENAVRDRKVADVKRLLTEMVERQQGIDRVRLFDRNLVPTLVSDTSSIDDEIPTSMLVRVRDSAEPEALYVRRKGRVILYYAVPLRHRAPSAAVMELVHLASGVDRRLHAAVLDVWLRLGIVVVVIVLITGLVLQRQVVRPLERLSHGIERLGQGRPAPPLRVRGRDELDRVAAAFNRMVEQLEAAKLKLVEEAERTLEAQRQLRQADKLAAMGKLASGIAHEVGTPLNIISARAEFVFKALPAESPERQEIEVILEQIDRISSIIRSMLDIVRPQEPRLEPLAVGGVIERLVSLLRPGARRRDVTLSVGIPQGLPMVRGDLGQLQQVIINVVVNALDAMTSGGVVDVQAEATTWKGRCVVAVTVSDTGSGIPAATLSRVFDPFFTTKPPGEGTGLGLAICRDILRAHGGDITAENRPGGGACFTIWIPVDATPATVSA